MGLNNKEVSRSVKMSGAPFRPFPLLHPPPSALSVHPFPGTQGHRVRPDLRTRCAPCLKGCRAAPDTQPPTPRPSHSTAPVGRAWGGGGFPTFPCPHHVCVPGRAHFAFPTAPPLLSLSLSLAPRRSYSWATREFFQLSHSAINRVYCPQFIIMPPQSVNTN